MSDYIVVFSGKQELLPPRASTTDPIYQKPRGKRQTNEYDGLTKGRHRNRYERKGLGPKIPLSVKTKEEILEHFYNRNMTEAQVASKLGCSEYSVRRVVNAVTRGAL